MMCPSSHPMRDQGVQILGSHEAILKFKGLDVHNHDAGLSGPHELDLLLHRTGFNRSLMGSMKLLDSPNLL